MQLSESVFKLGIGVDTYNPDIADGLSLKFKRLKNVQPERGRLQTPGGLSLLQTITDEAKTIRGFGFYTVPTSQFTSLYALSDSSIYGFNFATSLFSVTPLYSSFPDTTEAFAKTPWLDALYVTKRFGSLLKVQNNVVTTISDAPAGRYMIISDSHLMLANLTQGSTEYPVRIRWSDLYAPESFAVSPSSEADFFELSPDDGEVTALSYQRGITLAYTRDKIWTGRYFPSSDGSSPGRYKFEVLFPGVGNIYHEAQIRVKEVEFFIGPDNFYKLDGFQLSEVGDEIWDFFQATVADSNFQDPVIAVRDADSDSVSWVYDHKDGYKWSVVYNYKENKWSDRDPQEIVSSVSLQFPVRGYLSYDDLDISYDDIDDTYPPAPATYSGNWQFLSTAVRTLFGGSDGRVFVPSSPSSYVKHDDSSFSCEMETFEFDFEELQKIKEVNKLKLVFSCRDGDILSTSDLVLRVGTRKHRVDPVVWSEPVAIIDQLAGETVFHFRKDGVGKLLRFKLSWTNNTVFAITELVKLSLFKLENGNATPEK